MATEMTLCAASHSDQYNSIKQIGVNGAQTHLGLKSFLIQTIVYWSHEQYLKHF